MKRTHHDPDLLNNLNMCCFQDWPIHTLENLLGLLCLSVPKAHPLSVK